MKVSEKLNQMMFILGLLLLPFVSSSQHNDHKDHDDREMKKEHREKIEALKREYFTKELNLTDTEGTKFWALYDELETKLKENHKREREIGRELKDNFETLSDSEVKSKTDAIFALEIESIQLKKDYLQKYATVLGQKRATKVLHLERQFKRELMQRMNSENGGKALKEPYPNTLPSKN